MKYNPYDYQSFATRFILEHMVCALILDMGMGKSVITLTALQQLIGSSQVGKVLVVAPKRAAENTWTQELKKWDHVQGITYSVVTGSEEERLAALRRRAKIYIVSRDNVAWLVSHCYRNWDFDTLVIDELPSFKNSKTQRFRALKRVRPKINRVIGLTGTPQPNSLMDLWPQMYLVDMGRRLGRTENEYRRRFFLSYIPRENAEKMISKRISDICISMKAADYLDMPKLISRQVVVRMSDGEKKLYEDFRRDMVIDLNDGSLSALSATALFAKLVQMANGAVYGDNRRVHHIHDRKLDALGEIIEAANGRPVLVTYHFKHDLERIRQRFNARTLDTPEDIADWNAGKIPVAVINPASTGYGLNLQDGGSIIVWFSLTWSLVDYRQANARLWRLGQRHDVEVYHLITEGTYDEDIMKALERKDMNQAALIEAVKARIERTVYEQLPVLCLPMHQDAAAEVEVVAEGDETMAEIVTEAEIVEDEAMAEIVTEVEVVENETTAETVTEAEIVENEAMTGNSAEAETRDMVLVHKIFQRVTLLYSFLKGFSKPKAK